MGSLISCGATVRDRVEVFAACEAESRRTLQLIAQFQWKAGQWI
jgi:hypothetical protein